MNVLVLATPQDGITAVWTLPGDPLTPAPMARVPQADIAEAVAVVACKGDAKSWPDWAAELAEDSPYLGTFSVEDAPDPMNAQQALNYLRGRTFLHLAGLDEAPPPLRLTVEGTGTKAAHTDPDVMYDEGGGKPGDNCGECYMSSVTDGVMHCTMVADPIRKDDRCKRYVPRPVA